MAQSRIMEKNLETISEGNIGAICTKFLVVASA